MDNLYQVFRNTKLLDYKLKFVSVDKPDGTGDHENYFDGYFDVYELDGKMYTNCIKQAVHIRSVDEQISWWHIKQDYSIIFSKRSNYFWNIQATQIKNRLAVNSTYG